MKSVLGIVFFNHIPQVVQKARQEQTIENVTEDGVKGSSKGHLSAKRGRLEQVSPSYQVLD